METRGYFSCHIMLVKLRSVITVFHEYYTKLLHLNKPSNSLLSDWQLYLYQSKMFKIFLSDHNFSIWDRSLLCQFSSHHHYPNTRSSYVRLYFGFEGKINYVHCNRLINFPLFIEDKDSMTTDQVLLCLQTSRPHLLGYCVIITIILWRASPASNTTDLHKAKSEQQSTSSI